jgi:hypothetical protein
MEILLKMVLLHLHHHIPHHLLVNLTETVLIQDLVRLSPLLLMVNHHSQIREFQWELL